PGAGLLCGAVLAAGAGHGAAGPGDAVDPASDAGGFLALCGNFRGGLDRPVHRSPRGRQETVLLQGCAVSADRSGLSDGFRVPPPRLTLLSAVAAAGLNGAARATRPAAGHPAPNPRSAP